MSGSSIANLLLDVLEYDWTDSALEDVEFTVDKARNTLPFGSILPPRDSIMDWVKRVIEEEFKPKIKQRRKRDRLESVLIPPGNCMYYFYVYASVTNSFSLLADSHLCLIFM